MNRKNLERGIMRFRGRIIGVVLAAATIVSLSSAPPVAAAVGTPVIGGDPYHNGCALDSVGFNTSVITDDGHLHMTDPATGAGIGDAYLFYSPICQGYFLTILHRGSRYYVHPSIRPGDLPGPIIGLSSLYVGNGLAWTYLLRGMAGHPICGSIAVTTPSGQPVTTVDLGCGGPA